MNPEADRFLRQPHRTLAALAIPTVISLVAEPVAGIADTAFIARLGASPLAALGVATTLLSGVIWVFNFLGIGTQTVVARAFGSGEPERARTLLSTALWLAAGFGAALGALAWPLLAGIAHWMGADGEVAAGSVEYLQIRLLGVPAVLLTFVAFGALRGLQDMRTPLWISLAISALNVALDPLLIFGAGPVPAFGIAGAAWATTATQWLGAAWALNSVTRRLGIDASFEGRQVRALFVVGRDMVIRTGSLLLFLILATRVATEIGPESGAAHQGIRQIWMLGAQLLDAFAYAAQSLIGYFLGAGAVATARRVAGVACGWALATGAALALLMLGLEAGVEFLLVPASALAAFGPAWWVAALCQPLNALSFATDGIHFGTADYAYLRNAMIVATGAGAILLAGIDRTGQDALSYVWLATALWIGIRSTAGVVRIWPGIGNAPLGSRALN